MPLIYTSLLSFMGKIWFASTDQGVCRLAFGLDREEWLAGLSPFGAESVEDSELLAVAVEQLEEYLQGQRQHFDLALDLSVGTLFQQRVWAETQRVPYGQTISYSDLALRLGNPRAVRAIGGALGSNPVPIIVPCHRVIRADGTLGGYSAGEGLKGVLLELEGHRTSRLL